jgi:hypothetical protein
MVTTIEAYKTALEAARAELDSLLNEENDLETKLKEVRDRSELYRKTILGLCAMVGEDGTDEKEVGITQALRDFLSTDANLNFIWSPVVLNSRLKNAGFPLEKYKNALAVIHTTLKRMEDQNEVRSVLKDGKTHYQWIVKPKK